MGSGWTDDQTYPDNATNKDTEHLSPLAFLEVMHNDIPTLEISFLVLSLMSWWLKVQAMLA